MRIVNTERWQELHGFAQENRKKMTKAEAELWEVLRKAQFCKWYRQVVKGKFIIDFYAPKLKLGIEVDGGYHDARKDYDQRRTAFLYEHYDIKLLRFTNDEVLVNMQDVKRKVIVALNKYKAFKAWHKVKAKARQDAVETEAKRIRRERAEAKQEQKGQYETTRQRAFIIATKFAADIDDQGKPVQYATGDTFVRFEQGQHVKRKPFKPTKPDRLTKAFQDELYRLANPRRVSRRS